MELQDSKSKRFKTIEYLNYTPFDLMKHLESLFLQNMNWSNYGNKEGQWSIDHIIPISSFDLNTPLSEVNALSNLRPIWHIDNLKKGAKLNYA